MLQQLLLLPRNGMWASGKYNVWVSRMGCWMVEPGASFANVLFSTVYLHWSHCISSTSRRRVSRMGWWWTRLAPYLPPRRHSPYLNQGSPPESMWTLSTTLVWNSHQSTRGGKKAIQRNPTRWNKWQLLKVEFLLLELCWDMTFCSDSSKFCDKTWSSWKFHVGFARRTRFLCCKFCEKTWSNGKQVEIPLSCARRTRCVWQLVKLKLKLQCGLNCAAHQIFCCCAPDVCDKLEAAVAEEVWQ